VTSEGWNNLFVRERLIRFSHCDLAGIVFYPQYFVLFNDLVEDWFAEALGVGFPELHMVRGIGMPVVRVECEFVAPSRVGDRVDMALSVTHVGNASVGLTITCRCQGVDRLRAKLTIVSLMLAQTKSMPLPEDIRESISAFRGNLS